MQSLYRHRHVRVQLFQPKKAQEVWIHAPAFCRGEEDGLLSVKKVRFVGGRYIHISEGIRNTKEYIKARRSMGAT